MASNGCFGGLSPRGQIHISFYSERTPIPRRTEFYIKDGIAGPENIVETKKGVFRELESDIVMDLNTALGFYQWFREKIEQARANYQIPDAVWQQFVGTK
jgi:hypothetical protein